MKKNPHLKKMLKILNTNLQHLKKTWKQTILPHLQGVDRTLFVLSHDAGVAFFAIPMALWLRVGSSITHFSPSFLFKHAVVYTSVSLGIFLWVRLYRGVWRYVSSNELITIGLAVSCISIIYGPLMLLMNQEALRMPRSIILLSWIVMFLILGGSRFAYRMFHERFQGQDASTYSSVPQSRVLLVGANNQAEMFIRDLLRTPCPIYEVIGIVDTQKGKVGRYIHGVEIMGLVNDIPQIIEQLNLEGRHPHHLVIADQHMKDQRKVTQLLEMTSQYKIDLARLPNLDQFTRPGLYGVEIKPIQIEDLLGRNPTQLDRENMETFIKGKRIMVTGAGGTIGGELARQISAFLPESLILLDHSEYLLYTIDLELSELYPKLKRHVVLADVTDIVSIEEAFARHKPHVVFHAAALKHVPMAESHPHQAILTNIMGTKNVAETGRKHHVQAVIFISTDKAVRPTSVMGATKRIAECLCQALDAESAKSGKTRFITTRFGNVLGSTGSVVPLFKRQLAAGGPLTVTHKDVTRYFMTVQEAVELVLEAAVMGTTSPKTMGQIFVLDMGEPVKIIHLAEQMIQLAGLKPYEDIRIEMTGLRPGEKLYEELFLDKEQLIKTSCEALMLASPSLEKLDKLRPKIQELEKVALSRDSKKCQELLLSTLTEYQREPRAPKTRKNPVTV